MHIQVDNISKSIQGKPVLNDITLNVDAGHSLALIGPNGSGKSTLLRVMAGLLQPDRGQVSIDGDRIDTLSTRHLAQRLGFVSQNAGTTDAITVLDAVKLGRTPWLSLASPFGEKDEQIVDTALREMAIDKYRSERFNALSGGQKQRVHIARVLAQAPSIFLLDEPTNHLDIHHQVAIMDWTARQKTTVVLALHDLNHAYNCDFVAVLDQGRLVAFGAPDEILVPDVIEPIFQVKLHHTFTKHLDRPTLTFSKSDDIAR